MDSSSEIFEREGGKFMRIIPLTREYLKEFERVRLKSIKVFGRLRPTFDGKRWASFEELFEKPRVKIYPREDRDLSGYIDARDKAVFLAVSDRVEGQITLKSNWNNFAYVEELYVSESARGQGIGRRLVERAEDWAAERRLKGLMLETQDLNLAACRFYAKTGFQIGGADTLLYEGLGTEVAEERAIFWYKIF